MKIYIIGGHHHLIGRLLAQPQPLPAPIVFYHADELPLFDAVKPLDLLPTLSAPFNSWDFHRHLADSFGWPAAGPLSPAARRQAFQDHLARHRKKEPAFTPPPKLHGAMQSPRRTGSRPREQRTRRKA